MTGSGEHAKRARAGVSSVWLGSTPGLFRRLPHILRQVWLLSAWLLMSQKKVCLRAAGVVFAVTFDYSETVFTDPFDAVWLNRSQSRRPGSALDASRSLLGGAAPPGGRKRAPSSTGRRAEAFDLVKAPPAGKKYRESSSSMVFNSWSLWSTTLSHVTHTTVHSVYARRQTERREGPARTAGALSQGPRS